MKPDRHRHARVAGILGVATAAGIEAANAIDTGSVTDTILCGIFAFATGFTATAELALRRSRRAVDQLGPGTRNRAAGSETYARHDDGGWLPTGHPNHHHED